MNIFDKGDFQPVTSVFRTQGVLLLNSIAGFQESYDILDTDTTINQIRDCLVAHYLGYDLLNAEKHGFDAKSKKTKKYLEIKQCSTSSKRWGGTWNDTSEDKAHAFSDARLFTVIAIWGNACDLLCMVYGQHQGLGEYLLSKVINRKTGSRSTQGVSITKLITEFNFSVICPPKKTKADVYELLIASNRTLANFLTIDSIKGITDV
jgi:hypothetical protein